MKTFNLMAVFLLLTATAIAQPGNMAKRGGGPGMGMGPGGHGMGQRMGNWEDRDAIRDAFFPPEMIMRHADKLDITKDQRKTILDAQNDAQAKLNTLHWDLKDAAEALHETVSMDKVDAKKAADQLKKVIEIENQLKTTQLTLMITVKNQLNEKQLATLKEIKATQRDLMKDRKIKKEKKIRKVIRDDDGFDTDEDDLKPAKKGN